MNRSALFLGAAIAAWALSALPLPADDGAPRLVPGQTFTIRFPDMPPTFAELLDPKGIPPTMTVFLPRNYDPQRRHPLLIFLGGGGGSRGQNPVVARKLTEETDFVCVDLPLFKETLDPPAPGNGTSRLIMQANDGRFMWQHYKVMLAKLEAAVPNLDPAHRVLGGFSNGAHATAGLIDESDGEVARQFSAFLFGEGGGRLQHYERLKGKEFLMLYGSDQSGKRATEIYESARAAGAKATLREMKNVGHAFPESQYPAVRTWLRGGVETSGASTTGSEAVQTKTGTVTKVDVNGNRLTVMGAREMIFTITGETRITQGGKLRTLTDLKSADTVAVEYSRDGETRTARAIQVGTVKASASPPSRAAAPASGIGDSRITVQVGEQTRSCLLHVPPSHNGGPLLPVVIAFHGSGGRGSGMAAMTRFNTLADQHGFLAAYPDAIIGKGLWNSMFGTIPGGEGVLADDVDDVAFVRALIDAVEKSHHADPNRVFACGFSAGANMSYRLAIELADRIAAVGIVNGALGIKSVDGKPVPFEIPAPAGPISVLHICGKQDNTVKYAGAQTPKNLYRSAPDCIRFFVMANTCSARNRETTDTEHGLTRSLYSGGKAGTEVELIIVENCGHAWPTAQNGLDASEALWEFFAKHPKATP